MGLATETIAYQAMLEHHRTASDLEDWELLEDLTKDLSKAKRAMEVAWLESLKGE